jgi:hypothetical protein
LVGSGVFCSSFDFDEWYSISVDPGTYMRPYNGSFFELRSAYKTVFPEERFQINPEDDTYNPYQDTQKLYKVLYKINFLPVLSHYAVRNRDNSISLMNIDHACLMEMAIESKELTIFEQENFQMIINYKWDTFAQSL